MSDFVKTPVDMIATPPAGNKGGPGLYDGEEGFQKRTHSPNGVPEKLRDGSVPKLGDKNTNTNTLPKNI